MSKFANLALMCLGTAGVAVFAGLVTAGPSVAQGQGQGAKPVTEVKVVNSTANPVPVTVSNPTPAVDQGTPVAVFGYVDVASGSSEGSAVLYTVPQGSYLIIDSISFDAARASVSDPEHKLTIQSSFGGAPTYSFVAKDGELPSSQFGNELVRQYCGAGATVAGQILRDLPNNQNVGFSTAVSIQGRLFDVP